MLTCFESPFVFKSSVSPYATAWPPTKMPVNPAATSRSRASWTKDNSNFFIFPVGLITQGELLGIDLPNPSGKDCFHPFLLGEDFLGHAHTRENFAHRAGLVGRNLGRRIHDTTNLTETRAKSNSGDGEGCGGCHGGNFDGINGREIF